MCCGQLFSGLWSVEISKKQSDYFCYPFTAVVHSVFAYHEQQFRCVLGSLSRENRINPDYQISLDIATAAFSHSSSGLYCFPWFSLTFLLSGAARQANSGSDLLKGTRRPKRLRGRIFQFCQDSCFVVHDVKVAMLHNMAKTVYSVSKCALL